MSLSVRISCLVVACTLAGAAFAAPIRADSYAKVFNAVADKTGIGARISLDRCMSTRCYYVGDGGISVEVDADQSGWISECDFRIPPSAGATEITAILSALASIFSPEASSSARTTFVAARLEQFSGRMTEKGSRSEGMLKDWTYILRHDPQLDRDKIRIFVRRLDPRG